MQTNKKLDRNTKSTKTNRTDSKNNPTNFNKSNRGLKKVILLIELIILLVLMIGYLGYNYIRNKDDINNSNNTPGTQNITGNNKNPNNSATHSSPSPLTPEQIEQKRVEQERLEKEKQITELIQKADLLASGYDYDGAINLLKDFDGGYSQYQQLTTAIAGYEAKKAGLDPLGAYDSVDQISHIFFHSLIADNNLAFDGDEDSNGYNYYMTTVSEFKAMMNEMYKAGYVLVSIHDVAKKITMEDGTKKFVPGDIMLPPDKKPFVLSQDDLNYYNYMDHDGFASRIVIDENGRPSTAMTLEDGTVSVGDYDMVPVLETFIAEHPDFSYKGARGILAITGYEGAIGYRTDDPNSPTYKQDRETVKNVAKVLKEWGWEFASHSYGHRNMFTSSYNFVVKDTDRWMKEVGSLVGPTDIYVYPYGIEIEKTLGTYSSDKYKYLKGLGFDYFCGVFKDPWIHVKDDYVRMTRRPLDGQAMLQFPERLSDLFDLSKVIDPGRPALK